jgi:anti-sigma factor RsiW
MSTGCEFFADAIVEHAAGRLDAERRARVEAHVASCQDCREALEVIRALRSAPLAVPEDLEARLRAAVAPVAPAPRRPEAASPPVPFRRSRRSWRPWALPLAAAAGLAVAGLGIGQLVSTGPESNGDLELAAEYDPYGAWPGSDGVLAGESVLSDLTEEELEALLEEMEP